MTFTPETARIIANIQAYGTDATPANPQSTINNQQESLSPTMERAFKNMESMATTNSSTPDPAPSAAPVSGAADTPLRLPLAYNIVDKCTEEAYMKVQEWLNDAVHNCRERSRWLFIHGRPGAGKSHLAYNSARVLREFRRKTLTKRAADIANDLREGNSHLMHQIWLPSPFMIIDDLGSEYHTDFITAQWFDLLDARIGKWTIITSNLTPAQIGKRYDTRIQSRIEDSRNTIVDLSLAADYRKQLLLPTVEHTRISK